MAILITVFGTLWAAAYMMMNDYQNRPPFNEEANIALHLVSGHGFLSPFDDSNNAPQSAWSPPVYPLIIAASYHWFGIETPNALAFLMIIQAVCYGLFLAGIYSIGEDLFTSGTPGLLAAILLAFHPLYVYFVRDFWDSMLSLTMFVVLLQYSIRSGIKVENTGRVSNSRIIMIGVGMGLLSLTNAVYILTYPVFMAIAFPRKNGLKRWLPAMKTFVVFCLVITPWTLRNVQTFGKLMYVRSVYSFILFTGNQPGTYGWLYDESSIRMQPIFNAVERDYILSLGEVGYEEFCKKRFEKLYNDNPMKFWHSCLVRAGYVLLGNPKSPAEYPFISDNSPGNYNWDQLILNAVFSLFGAVGILLSWKRGFRPKAVAALAFIAAIPLIPSGVIDRYTLVTRAILILFASFSLWVITNKIRHRRGMRKSISNHMYFFAKRGKAVL